MYLIDIENVVVRDACVRETLKDLDLLTYLTYIFNMDIFNNISIVIPSYNEENYIYNSL